MSESTRGCGGARPLRIALVVPPTVNLNTPYAAVPRLAGWLRHLGHHVVPVDLSLELFLKLFSRDGLTRMFAAIDPSTLNADNALIYSNRERYIRIIDDAVAVLQLRDMSATTQIVRGGFLPLGPKSVASGARPGVSAAFSCGGDASDDCPRSRSP